MEHGKRLIPHVIDWHAENQPDCVWAAFPTDYEHLVKGELQNVTWKTLANAINTLAWWLIKELGRSTNLETLGYIGPSDIRYFVFATAACKVGYKTLFSSPRNTIEAHLSLFEKTGCHTLVGVQGPVVQNVLSNRSLNYLEMLPLEELLQESQVPKYEYNATYEEAAGNPFLTLHTSGSTGLPKPVDVTHGLLACLDSMQDLPAVHGRSVTAQHYKDTSLFSLLPPFHSAGINFFAFSVFQNTRLILSSSDRLPSLDVVQYALKHGFAQAGIMPPSILMELAESPELLEYLSSWKSVAFGGGPLHRDAGKVLRRYTAIHNILGSTETKNLPVLAQEDPEDWEYQEFHPSLSIELRHYSENLHELVFVRKSGKGWYSPAFQTFPDLEEYSMKDLYSPHEDKPGLWLYRGRADDIVVLANGEKFNPVDAEKIIPSHPAIKAALITGTSKQQPALLIEPAEAPVKSGLSLDAIWEAVAGANDVLPGHAQLDNPHVKILDGPDVFLRSTKGTVQRKVTNLKLERDIEELYQAAESASNSFELDFSSIESLHVCIAEALKESGMRNAEALDVHANLFACGIDSLHSLRFARKLRTSVPSASNRIIYTHPTIDKLAHALVEVKEGRTVTNVEGPDEKGLQKVLNEHLALLKSPEEGFQKQFSHLQDTTVLLTGSTGGLGSYLLDALLAHPAVHQVVCLNRAGSGLEKQSAQSAERGLNTDFSRVEFLEVDLTRQNFGLSKGEYERLMNTATHVIHNAWAVNFNLPLSAFEDQIEGCRNLIIFSMHCNQKVHVHFISSIGAANNWSAHSEDAVPEAPLDDLTMADNMGYAQSKQISELLFDHAGHKLGLSATVCRVGQIAGPVKRSQGAWNEREWFPSLIKSSKYLGKLPSSLGSMGLMDWIPADILANIIAETMMSSENTPDVIEDLQRDRLDECVSRSSDSTPELSDDASNSPYSKPASPADSLSPATNSGTDFIHLVNPHTADWNDMIPHVRTALGGEIQIVSYEDWLDALQSSVSNDGNEGNPAVKLLDFFEENRRATKPVFSTVQAQRRSKSLANLQPVCGEWIDTWMRQWQF